MGPLCEIFELRGRLAWCRWLSLKFWCVSVRPSLFLSRMWVFRSFSAVGSVCVVINLLFLVNVGRVNLFLVVLKLFFVVLQKKVLLDMGVRQAGWWFLKGLKLVKVGVVVLVVEFSCVRNVVQWGSNRYVQMSRCGSR